MNNQVFGPLTVSGNRYTLALKLDPAQNYLNHHRVGGKPLLGNAMAIEAMGATAVLSGARGKICVEDVRGPNPCFAEVPRTISVEAVRSGNEFSCRVFDRKDGDDEVYFTAELRFGVFEAPPAPLLQIPDAAVSCDEIYKLYFHGHAFQVIEKAWLEGTVMHARMNRSIPDIFFNGSPVAAANMIEQCMQTAGLWHVAFSGKMLIPEVIGRIVVHENIDKSCTDLVASAEKGTEGMTILLSDPSGKVYIEIKGYRAAALPVPADEAAVQRLRALILSS